HAIRSRYTKIILTATENGHVATRDAERCQRICHGVRTALREPLVVASRARSVGVTGHLEPHRAARLVLLRRGLDDPLALRGDVVLIPIEEHQVHLWRWWRHRRRWQWRRRRRWGAKLHRHAGHDILRVVAGRVATGAAIGPSVALRERVAR